MNAQPTADPTLDPEQPARGGLLSLRVKFLGAIGAGVLASGIVAGTALVGLGSVSTSADALATGNLKQAELVSSVDGNLTRVDINILRMLAVGGKDNIAGWKAENDTRFDTIDGLLAKLDASPKTPAEAKVLEHLEASFDDMRSGMKKQVDAIEAGDPVGAAAINAQYVKDPANAAYGDLTTLAALNAKESSREVARGHAAQSSARTWLLTAFGVGALLAFALGLQIVRSVLARLRRVQASLEAMATGDLTVSPGSTSGDEVARMASALVDAQTGVKSMISSVAAAATQLSGEVRSLSATSAQIATTAGRTSAQTQEMSAAAGQVSSNVQIVAAGSSEMDASIREIAQNTNRAAEVAREAVAAAEATTATVTKLGDSSAQIATVVQVINTIAAQTNLLALNATIEAARAGEAGKGFAVVAGEVKELAQETAKATEDISRRVQAIQADSVSASAAIEEIAGIIERISDSQVAIASAVEEQTATTNEMARNVSEASAGSARIASDVAEVAAAAEATTRDASASEAATAELLRMSSELQRLVGQFRC